LAHPTPPHAGDGPIHEDPNSGEEPTDDPNPNDHKDCGCGDDKLGFSEEPIRYFDGMPNVEVSDASSDGFGRGWGITRSYLPSVSGPLGYHWMWNQLPYIESNIPPAS